MLGVIWCFGVAAGSEAPPLLRRSSFTLRKAAAKKSHFRRLLSERLFQLLVLAAAPLHHKNLSKTICLNSVVVVFWICSS
jgi:hypothetical protein